MEGERMGERREERWRVTSLLARQAELNKCPVVYSASRYS